MEEFEEYKPNSNKSKEEAGQKEKKEINKVTKGKVIQKKATLGKKIADIFIAEDISEVKSHIFWDVVVPKIKDGICDILINSIQSLFGGGGPRRGSGTSSVNYGGVSSYKSYNRVNQYPVTSTDRRYSFEYDDIILTDKSEAEEKLSTLEDMISNYGQASIMDLYDILGLKMDYTQDKYGWRRNSIGCFGIEHVREGYLLKLPKVVPLD